MNSCNNYKKFNHIKVLVFICSCAVFMFLFLRSGVCPSVSQFSFDLRYVEENVNSLDQTNPHLILYSRAKYLNAPSTRPYNLSKYNLGHTTERPLAEWVLKFYRNKRNGVFLEAGAYDGETNSNTLKLEKEFGWTGLLVECNPQLVPHILTKHRKAWVAAVCLSPNSTPGTFNFVLPKQEDNAATIGKPLPRNVHQHTIRFDVQAMPLYTLLAALDWKEIDFFNFDVEGVELDLMRSFPFDKIIFRVIIVEIQYYSAEEKLEMRRIFEKNEYVFVEAIDIDHIYVHKSVVHLIPK